MLSVEDFTKARSGSQMVSTVNGNVYSQPAGSTAKWLVVWSRPATAPAVFTDLAAYRSSSGHESTGANLKADAVAADGTLLPSVAGTQASAAQPLPADVAAKAGLPAGLRLLGYLK